MGVFASFLSAALSSAKDLISKRLASRLDGIVLVMYRPSATGLAAQKKGIVLAIGASFFFSLNSCFDRLAVLEGTPVFAGFAMTLLSAGFLLPFIVWRRDRLESLRVHRG